MDTFLQRLISETKLTFNFMYYNYYNFMYPLVPSLVMSPYLPPFLPHAHLSQLLYTDLVISPGQ